MVKTKLKWLSVLIVVDLVEQILLRKLVDKQPYLAKDRHFTILRRNLTYQGIKKQ